MDVKLFLHAQWDRILGWLSILSGIVVLWIGWLGISGTALSYEQMPYVISGGLFGIVLIAIGSTVLLSADLRDEWRKLDRLDEHVLALLAGQQAWTDNGYAVEPTERTERTEEIAPASNGVGTGGGR